MPVQNFLSWKLLETTNTKPLPTFASDLSNLRPPAMGNFFSSPAAAAESSSEPSPVVSFHSIDRWGAHFDTLQASDKLLVIDFSAAWCGPCRYMEPVFKELAATFTDVAFAKIDVDELQAVAQEWKVEAMPTFVMVKKGKEVDRLVGAKKEDLRKKILLHKA